MHYFILPLPGKLKKSSLKLSSVQISLDIQIMNYFDDSSNRFSLSLKPVTLILIILLFICYQKRLIYAFSV